MIKSKSLLAFFVCCTLLIALTVYHEKQQHWGNWNGITFDAAGYYLYLPSVFYDNLGTLNNRQYIIDNYRPDGNDIDAHLSPKGKYVMKYSSGQAIMFFPGFALGHIFARLGHYPVDGFSVPYQISMFLYSTLFCCLGLWFIRKVLLVYFDDLLVAYTLLMLKYLKAK